MNDDCCAVAMTRVVEQPIERPALHLSTDQRGLRTFLRATDEIHEPVP
jgi:hypothetical protein